MRIDYLGLEAFVAIADHGSFLRAAETLSLSKTALSHRLRKLEEDLGTPLLIRSSREVSLTASGQGVLPDARRLLRELHQVYDSVRVRSHRMRRTLSFACVPTVANSLMPSVIAAFGKNNPDIGIEVIDIPVAQISERVRSGMAEFGLTIVSAELPDLRVTSLIEEEYRLLVPAGHEFAKAGQVTRADLVGRAMVRISSQSKNRQLVDIALAENGDEMIWQYEVQNANTAMRLVAEGAALTVLPNSAISMAPASLVSVPFVDVRLMRRLGFVTRRGVTLTNRAAVMMSMIEKRIHSLGQSSVPLNPAELQD